MKLCHTCLDHNIDYAERADPEEAKWIKKAGLNPIPIKEMPNKCKIHYPENSDIEITIKQKKIAPGTKIIYWAARPKKLLDAAEIDNAKVSYCRKNDKNFKNHGCTKVKKNGEIVIKIMSPRCYRERGTLWAKHIHFVKEKDGDWERNNFYTVLGTPSQTKQIETKRLKYNGVYIKPETIKKTWKKADYYMVYALSKDKPSLVDLERYEEMKHIRIDHSSKNIRIPKQIKKETPLVVYCASEACSASKELIVKLADKGYENLFYMDAGMIGFSKESYKLFTEDSTKKSMKNYSKMLNLI